MRADLPATIPLVCPCCRSRDENGRNMHTLSLARQIRVTDDDEVIEGTLVCDGPACAREYPIVDGIPIVVADLATFLRTQISSVVEGELAPETAAQLAGAGPDDGPYPLAVEHLGIYLDAHWGDRVTPAHDGPGPAFGFEAISERLQGRARSRVVRAVELGCSVGRGLSELALGAALTVGVDLHFGALRRARRLLRGEPVAFARRMSGRHYWTAIAEAGDLSPLSPGSSAGAVALVCGDALDPPLVPGTFNRVAAFNVLDSVSNPSQLLSVADGLCAPAGELLLSSPYTWQTHIVDEDQRFGKDDPAAELTRRLREGLRLEERYTIEEESTLPWWLRRDARSANLYQSHYLRARKRSQA